MIILDVIEILVWKHYKDFTDDPRSIGISKLHFVYASKIFIITSNNTYKPIFIHRKTDNKHDMCMMAQQKLHPVCAQRIDGASQPTCLYLAETCRENKECRYAFSVLAERYF